MSLSEKRAAKKAERERAAGAAASARRTLGTEAAGLAALREALGNGLAAPFSEAVEIVDRATRPDADGRPRGRVVVSGVGKSGHVGRKIAATLASTGTPAFFVHPAEAGHGDLGMVAAREDVIFALSWSGESVELRAFVEFARRFGNKLIAVTAKPESSLARQADLVLLLPDAAEACPHGLAPTTSTIMQMALGDALAIALLEARGFTAEDFHVFHPGGQLGAKFHFVREIMHRGAA
ncbi:MAG TPA: SIS domain-containing protein, partial [Bauldia sp.]|nr:SIS domain-containing protein [Bauldia sp.]